MNHRVSVEQALRRWLCSHYQVIGRSEALACGATPSVVAAKLSRDEWRRIYRGVYRDTAVPVTAYQRLRAVHVATAGRAIASHSSAAWLWGLIDHPPARLELSAPADVQHGRRLPGIVIYRSADLDPRRAGSRRGILTTNPLRTLVDLGGTLPSDQLSQALDRGLSSRLVDLPGLKAELDRLARHGRAGPAALRGLLLERGFTGAPHPSVLESKMLRLIDRSGLLRPERELRAGYDGQYRLDFAYPAVRFAIEVDGYVWHFSPEHARRDHARRNDLQRQGWVLLVYTWRDVVDWPDRVAAEMRATYYRLAR